MVMAVSVKNIAKCMYMENKCMYLKLPCTSTIVKELKVYKSIRDTGTYDSNTSYFPIPPPII